MRSSWSRLVVIACGACGGGGNDAGDGGTPLPEGPLTMTVPAGILVDLPLTANTPVTQGMFVDLPSTFELGTVTGITVDVTTTLANATLMRTDGQTTGTPTLDLSVRVQAGDAVASDCSGGTVAGAVTITGSNGGFTSRTADATQVSVGGDALAILNNNSFSLCATLASSVDAMVRLGDVAAVFEMTPCITPPKDIAGVYRGTYVCNDMCGGQPSTDGGDIEITVLQSGTTAAYIDDGGAVYFGSVCGGAFRHLGGKATYWEYGTFDVTGDAGHKQSTWISTLNAGCGGVCEDHVTRVP